MWHKPAEYTCSISWFDIISIAQYNLAAIKLILSETECSLWDEVVPRQAAVGDKWFAHSMNSLFTHKVCCTESKTFQTVLSLWCLYHICQSQSAGQKSPIVRYQKKCFKENKCWTQGIITKNIFCFYSRYGMYSFDWIMCLCVTVWTKHWDVTTSWRELHLTEYFLLYLCIVAL